MLALMFLGALLAFVLITLFMVWYYRFMANLIFGKMNAMIDSIISEGAPPVQWHGRINRLNKLLSTETSAARKNKAIEKYIKFVKVNTKDMLAYAKKTSFIADEERPQVLASLERFCEETVQTMSDLNIKGDQDENCIM